MAVPVTVSAGDASALLRGADEDRWLSTRYAPTATRDRLTALFLLYHEIERVPEAVKEPPIGEIRLQWWRDAIAAAAQGEGPRGHPALDAARAARLFDIVAPAEFEPIIEARAHLFYEPWFDSPEALAVWSSRPEGELARLAVRIADPASAAPEDALRAAAAAFATVRGRSLLARPDDTLDGVLAAARENAGALRSLGDAARAAVLYLALTRVYARTPRPGAAARRWRLFSAFLTGDLEPGRAASQSGFAAASVRSR